MKTIDIKSKIICQFIGAKDANYFTKNGQAFYYSPTKKQVHLAEKLPCGDYWIVKTWNTSTIVII